MAALLIVRVADGPRAMRLLQSKTGLEELLEPGLIADSLLFAMSPVADGAASHAPRATDVTSVGAATGFASSQNKANRKTPGFSWR